MHRNIRSLSYTIMVALAIVALPMVAHADVELSNVEWQTMSGTEIVQFHLQWYNPDMSAASLAVSGEVHAQTFGVFVPDEGLIGTFDIPPIPPESFFDVYFEVPLGQLPPLPEEGYSSKPTQLPQIPCPPGDHWDGNIDIMWMGPGGTGQANYHLGQINYHRRLTG